MKIDTILIDKNKTSQEIIKNYLSKVEELNLVEIIESDENLYNKIEEIKPNLIVVDISENIEYYLGLITKISKNHKNIKIVVTSYDTDSELIVKTLRVGAHEYLIKPLIENDFIIAIKKMKDLIEGNIETDTKCKVISVFSNKGGLGKTSIATNIAVELANLTKEKVALVDLNMQMGDVTTFLNLNPVFDTSYVIRNLDKFDKESMLSALERYKETSLYVLSDPFNLEQTQNITAENITNLINILKKVFSYVVIDTTSGFEEKTLYALDNSDLILLISTINVPSARNCQRCFDLFDNLKYPKDKVKLVINRYVENDNIKAEDFENAIQHSIYFKIPNNYFAAINAVNQGVPISDIESNSNIAQSFKELASLLSDNYTYEQQATKIQKRNSSLLDILRNQK